MNLSISGLSTEQYNQQIKNAMERATRLMVLMPKISVNTDFSELLHNFVCADILNRIKNNQPLTDKQQHYWDNLYQIHCEKMAAITKEGQSATWYRYGNEELIRTTMLEQ